MKPELIKFVAGTKAKASEVNENFEKVLDYAETASAVVSFDINTEYKFGQWVLGQVDDEFGFYESLVDRNKGHLLSDENYWKKVSMGGGGLEIGDIGIAPLGIDESLGKRRYLNGSVIVQDQYQVFAERVKTAIQTYAGLGCTEEEWQTISSMSVGGQCGKFVVDDEAGTIRLPKIIMPIQGLTDLTKLGEIVEGGLPNIEGNFLATTWQNAPTSSGAFRTSSTVRSGYRGASANDCQWTISFDASRSNSIYSNSTTVQQEQIQYPYFIQVATGASYQENITNKIELNIPFVLLDGRYFAKPIFNSSWLKSSAGYTGSLAVHPSAYNALLIEQNPDVEVGTTVDNYTKRGLPVKLDTEDFTDYDFVLNTTSQVFRCPLKLQLNYSSLGISINLDELGLEIETSEENLYFYVGAVTQNPSLVNIGRIEEKVASLIPDNSSLIAGYGMPSNRYTTLTLGASGSQYTAPANGWVNFNNKPSASGYLIGVKSLDTNIASFVPTHNANASVSTFIPVKKGERIEIYYDGTLHSVARLVFIYAEGDE